MRVNTGMNDSRTRQSTFFRCLLTVSFFPVMSCSTRSVDLAAAALRMPWEDERSNIRESLVRNAVHSIWNYIGRKYGVGKRKKKQLTLAQKGQHDDRRKFHHGLGVKNLETMQGLFGRKDQEIVWSGLVCTCTAQDERECIIWWVWERRRQVLSIIHHDPWQRTFEPEQTRESGSGTLDVTNLCLSRREIQIPK